jgi:hypothetical protein
MAAKRSRYLGVQPFKTGDRHIFFGRDEDIENLLDFIMLEKLVVLFGKSGYGKSSLLSAGIVPRLTDPAQPDSFHYLPVELRLGPYTKRDSFSPLETTRRFLQDIPATPDLDFLKNLTAGDSHWLHVKQRQAAANGQFVLIFDQFEEFFSYPPGQQEVFRRQISELLYSDIPQTVRTRLDTLSDAERSLVVRPLQVKVVFSIRSDRLSLLDGMKDVLPAILHKRYELRALTPAQAREAIVRPARLPQSADFLSPAFAYTQEALDTILKALTTARTDEGRQPATAGIEAFQLQIVCEYLEGLVRDGKAPAIGGVPMITEAELPKLDSLYENYYRRKLADLPTDLRRPAELLLEEGLLAEDPATGEGRRMSVDSRALQAVPGLLEQLEKTYLIRREANTVGGFSIEISHDTLVAPIQKAKAERRAVEAQERLRREAEAREAQLAEERRKRRRANLSAVAGFLLFALAVIAAFWAWRQTQLARQEKENAENSAREALRQKAVADSLTDVAQTERNNALAALEKSRRDQINKLLAEGQSARSEKRFADALRTYDSALNLAQTPVEKAGIARQRAQTQAEKNDADFEYNRRAGLLLKEANQCIAAIPYLEAALKVRPGDTAVEKALAACKKRN